MYFISMAESKVYEGSTNAYLNEHISSLEAGISPSSSYQNNQVLICCALAGLISLKLSIAFYTKFIRYRRSIRINSRELERNNIRHNAD